MAVHARDTGLGNLTFARGLTEMLYDGISPDKLLHAPFPGANHALWIMGHLATTDDMFLGKLMPREPKLLAKWGELFGMGSKPVGDAAAYPSFDEIRAAFRNMREELMGWLKSQDDAAMARPLPEGLEMFAPNLATFMGNLAAHESLHAGQLTVIRKHLGLAPKIG